MGSPLCEGASRSQGSRVVSRQHAHCSPAGGVALVLAMRRIIEGGQSKGSGDSA